MSEEKEIWKDIAGYEGFYQVSNLGRVRSLDRVIVRKNGWKQTFDGKLLKPKTYKNGYLFVCINNAKTKKYITIHRLVATAFLDNKNNYPVINHKDENIKNNNANNLEWCTQSYNLSYGMRKEKQIETLIATGHVKKVYQFTMNGDFVSEYRTIKEAQDATGITNISSVCRGKYNSAGGFLWSHNNISPTNRRGKTSKKVVCFRGDNGIVFEYSSLRSAERLTGIPRNKISEMCRSNDKKWEFKYEKN